MSNRKASGATASRSHESKPVASKRKNTAKVRGANTAGVSLIQRFYAWLDNHRRSCAETLLRLLSSGLSSVLTWLVIGIALSLPVGLYVMLNNIQLVAGDWGGNAKISVYFETTTTKKQALLLKDELLKDTLSVDVVYLSADDAKAEFEALSGYSDILSALPNNPLPALLELTLQPSVDKLTQVETLASQLEENNLVESVQLDLHWVQRLQAMIALAQQAVVVLAVLLAGAVLLVTMNTIRLAIEARREEIVIIKLVGGTDAFVRRPLLYTGFWYGLGGAVFALCIVQLSTWLLSGPTMLLMGLYDYVFDIAYLSIDHGAILLLTGALLGLIGAWISVTSHLSAIEPK